MKGITNYKMLRAIDFALLVFIFSTVQGKKEANLLFENFSIRDGLPTNNIQQVIQDTTGYLWIATENGLSRFDGENFHNYYFSVNDSFSISSNFINRLFVSSVGNLWIGTWNGLNRYDPVRDRFERFIPNPLLPLGNELNIISSIDEAVDGTIYFLSEGGFLFNLENGQIQTKLNLQQPHSKFMFIDDKNRCWISSQNTIFRYNIKTNLTTQFHVKYQEHIQDPEITDMMLIDNSQIGRAHV